jgi:hypothetical protein
LAAWLRSDDVEGARPHPVEEAGEPGLAQAAVVSDVVNGEIFLKSQAGQVYRLRWDSDSAGEKRVVPPGDYVLFGYRLMRGEWILSGAGGRKPVRLPAGATRSIPIDPSVVIELTAAKKDQEIALSMSARGHEGMGVSLYRLGTRIAIPYQIEKQTGVAEEGTMKYG